MGDETKIVEPKKVKKKTCQRLFLTGVVTCDIFQIKWVALWYAVLM